MLSGVYLSLKKKISFGCNGDSFGNCPFDTVWSSASGREPSCEPVDSGNADQRVLYGPVYWGSK